jgi:hypothetical protein
MSITWVGKTLITAKIMEKVKEEKIILRSKHFGDSPNSMGR